MKSMRQVLLEEDNPAKAPPPREGSAGRRLQSSRASGDNPPWFTSGGEDTLDIPDLTAKARQQTSDRCDPRLVRRLNVFASASAGFAVAVGLLGLAGWELHIASLDTWGVSPVRLVPNTAASCILLGVALWLLRREKEEESRQPFAGARKLIARISAAIVCLMGVLVAVEHICACDLGFDQLLFAVPGAERIPGLRPGLVASSSACAFILLSTALLLLNYKTRRGIWLAQYLAFATAIVAIFGFFALLIAPGVSGLTMAFPSAVAFLVLAAGLLGSRPTWVMGGLLSSQSAGAQLLRKVVPLALLVLTLVGWSISKPLLTEAHFTWVQASILAIFCGALLVGFVTWIAFIVDRSDTERRKAEEALGVSKEDADRPLGRLEEPQAEAQLRRNVNVGFAVAVLLTSLLAFLSWRAAHQAEDDAAWVAHTHEVSTALETMLRHLDDVETGARGFALTGSEPFLEPYKTGKYAVAQDLQTLRLLVADNSDQRPRLEPLQAEANARIESATNVVTMRQNQGKPPTEARMERGEQLMDAARSTIAAMEDTEKHLLEQRTQRARAATRFNISIIALGSLLGVIFLSMAGFTVSREIGVSARARAQVNTLNAELEHRVAQRTAALGDSEGRLAGVVQSATDSIITVDEEQRIVLFNSAAERIFRCPAAEALGQSLTRFIPQRLHAAHAEDIRRFGHTDVTNRAMAPKGLLWALRADGHEFQIEASISQVVTGGKKLFTVILRDVTERVQAAEARERLAAIVEFSDDAIISKTLDGTITAWNHGAEKVFGYTASEAVGKKMWMIVPPERASEESDILAQIARGGSVEHFETIRVRKDGTHIDVSVTISPIRDNNGVIVGASKIARDITDRKQAEGAIREQAQVMDSAQVFVRDMESRVVYWPQGAEKLYGFTSQEALGILSHDLFHTQFPEPLETIEKKLLETGMWEGELIHRKRDGGTIVVSSAWALHRDSQGRPVRILETNIDITASKRAAEELSVQASELALSRKALEAQTAMFQLVLDNMGEGLVAADREGHFLIWNNSAKKLMGRGADDLPTEQWTPHYKIFLPDGITPYPPDRLPLVRALHGESVRVELMVQPPENLPGKFLEVTARPLSDAAGGLCGGVAVLHDITERKQVETALAGQAEELSRQAEELIRSRLALETQTLMLQSVLDSISEGLVVANEKEKFVVWNPAAERILGFGPTKLPSEQWPAHYGFFLPDTVTPLLPEQVPLIRALHGEVCTAEMFVRNPKTPEGVWIEASASPLIDKNGITRGGVIAFRDVSHNKVAEREIHQLNDELEIRVLERTAELKAANKELEAFSYSVSHDLRAPLRHISGFSQLLVEEFGATLVPEAQRYVERIQSGTQRMGLLVDELLNLARVGRHALNPRVTNLNDLVAEVVTMLQPESEGRQVEWVIADLPPVDCDPILVKQVLQNLLANALKFTRHRAPSVIEVGCGKEEEGHPVFMIRDNGTGFDMKYVDKLFGVFQRLHSAEEFEGTGIGLATVQRIVHKHEGRVWAEAEVDKGATFYFTLGAQTEAKSKSNGATAGGQR